ncbi:geranylgeranylglycerol-phosphate geranylgeranyltransferase [candidate division KSB1 bacterium]|nr:geranylgeranylglycerol-phosphate geranylgeranyltransferase [candidate division KSB1 bacterium]
MLRQIQGYILLTRPLNLIIAFISVFIGGFITGTVQPVFRLLMACTSATLIAGGANAINDVFDLAIDRINKPNRPLPSGMVTVSQARIFAILLFIAGMGVSLTLQVPGFTIALISSITLYAYSWKLKRTVLWGNFAVAFFSGLAFVYGGLAVHRFREAFVVGIFSMFYHFAREIIKDTEDVAGDVKDGVVTFPIRFGEKAALQLSTVIILILIGLTLLPYFLGIFTIHYLWVVVFGVDCFLVYVIISMWRNGHPKNLRRLAFLMKLNMFMGLLAVYVGT